MHARDGHIGRRERLDDPIFAIDRMRRLEQRARRLLAHHKARIRSLEHESGIRLPANELPNDKRPPKVRHPLPQITFERALVEPMILTNRADIAVERHYFALPV